VDTTFIYALVDPETGEPRYIGKSNNPRHRFYAHNYRGDAPHKDNWLKKLKSSGLLPLLEILDEVPASEWEEYEQEYIRAFRVLGFDLTNATAGGDGGPIMRGKFHPMFRKTHSPESKAKCAAPHVGRKHTTQEIVRRTESRRGTIRIDNMSGVSGVSWDKENCKWRAMIQVDGKSIKLGRFLSLEKAIEARQLAEIKHWGSCAP